VWQLQTSHCKILLNQKTGNVRTNLTLRRIRVPLSPLTRNKYYKFWVRVCTLSYPTCKAHAPYYIVFCGLPLLCSFILPSVAFFLSHVLLHCLLWPSFTMFFYIAFCDLPLPCSSILPSVAFFLYHVLLYCLLWPSFTMFFYIAFCDLPLPCSSSLSHKRHDFRKKKELLNTKCAFWLSLRIFLKHFSY
jgi:hypothetical protein